jgi:hypothetical protein
LPSNLVIVSPPICRLSHDSRVALMAVATRLIFWDTTTASLTQQIQLAFWLTTLSLNRAGDVALTGTSTGKLLLWRLENQEFAEVALEHHQESVVDGHVSQDGKVGVSVDAGRAALAVWDLEGAVLQHAIPLLNSTGSSVVKTGVNGSAQHCFVAYSNAEVMVWDTLRGVLLRRLTCGKNGEPTAFAVAASGRTLLYAGLADSAVCLHDSVTGNNLHRLPVSGAALVAADMVEIEQNAVLVLADASGLTLKRLRITERSPSDTDARSDRVQLRRRVASYPSRDLVLERNKAVRRSYSDSDRSASPTSSPSPLPRQEEEDESAVEQRDSSADLAQAKSSPLSRVTSVVVVEEDDMLLKAAASTAQKVLSPSAVGVLAATGSSLASPTTPAVGPVGPMNPAAAYKSSAAVKGVDVDDDGDGDAIVVESHVDPDGNHSTIVWV